MLVATQPAFLKALIPDIAWDQGFMSRVVMIYSAKRMKKPLFGNTDGVPMEALAKRLEPVGELYGEQTFTEEAIAFINTQYAADWPPQPKHFRLINYNERRTVHVLKLSAISAASGLSLKIELEDVQRAVGWVHQAEVAMPEVFHSMAASDDGTLTRESFDYVMTECNRTGKAVPEHNLIQFLAARTSSAKVEKLMEVLVSGKLVIPEGTQGKMAYTPGRLV